MKIGGCFSAAIIIFGTTVDDTVWLVPFVTSNHLSVTSKLGHALLFIGTLQVLTLFCVLLASGMRVTLPILGLKDESNQEHFLTCISAILCWVIAAIFFLKAFLKRRRRRRNAAGNTTNITSFQSGEDRPLSLNENKYYSEWSEEIMAAEQEQVTHTSFSPITVVTLTTIGALDELSYFPSLLTGRIFSPFQLLVGALVASMTILLVISAFLSQSKTVLDFLDRIPLYAIIAVFASILTIQSLL